MAGTRTTTDRPTAAPRPRSLSSPTPVPCSLFPVPCSLFPLLLLLAGCVCGPEEQATQQQVHRLNDDGVFLYQKGDYLRAKETFEVALAKQPEDPALLYNLGQCYDRLGQGQQAEETYRLCLNKAPNHAACRHALARLMMLDGRRGEATEAIETWLASQPGQADAYVQDAWRWQQDGDLPRAQARLQQALEIEPHNVRALTQMGVLYELMERPDRALVLYETALQKEPDREDLKGRVNMLLAKGVKRPRPD